jgi:hypothetical protein
MYRGIVILTLVTVRRKGISGDFFLDGVRDTEAGYGSGVIVWFARGRHGGSDAAIVSFSSSLFRQIPIRSFGNGSVVVWIDDVRSLNM